jgi:hypothetical protein
MKEPDLESDGGEDDQCEKCASVLVVDDQEVNVFAMQLVLRRMKIRTDTVNWCGASTS